jgi:hypothetical protein
MLIKRTNCLLLRIITLLLLLLLPHSSNVKAQSGSPTQSIPIQRKTIVESDTYRRVLETLFPQHDPAAGGTLWKIVLRFNPSSQPESQIIIQQSADDISRFQIIEYELPDGSIYNQLNQYLAQGNKTDVTQMAKSIKVKRKEANITRAQARQWRMTFYPALNSTTNRLRVEAEAIEKTGTEAFVIHGAFYEVWLYQGLKKISVSLQDVDIDKARPGGEYKLVQWMNSVRLSVGKLAK